MQQTITLAGGCFWCLEAVFRQLRGVNQAVSGYTGGHTVNPTYKQVCTGTTGHAEVVRVAYDPEIISLEDLLAVFFASHDPTTLNRQGNDVGTQYRSGIFYHSQQQNAVARQCLQALQAHSAMPIVTELVPATTFYPAEDYHQDYFLNNPNQPYCMVVVAEKVHKIRKLFPGQVIA